MSKHTPGKWEAEEIGVTDAGDAGIPVFDIVAGGMKRIATVAGEEDAHLVAAAPDLLFELEGIVAFSDGFGLYGNGPAAQELRKWIAGARTAIARATGAA